MRYSECMDADTVADTLYGLPRDEFTAARDERVREARSAGDRDLASEIGRLRKPSTAAWLVNLLVRDQPADIDGLVGLGGALRQAHSELDGEALRRLSGQRHELVAALVRQARAIGRSAGHRVSEAVARELESTFTAALTDPGAARAVATGRLTSSLDAGSSGDWSWTPGGDGQQPERDDPGRPQHGRRPAPKRSRTTQHDRMQRDLDTAREDASAAASEREGAEHAATEAERREAEANHAVADRRAELEAAERAADDAVRESREARSAYETAERRAQDARHRVQDLEERLDQQGRAR
ncbi:MAG: hypothetical protein GEV09_13725 [Pseudonocardiaceae bacterium]|nr:hypothetical protein [Pseudonocardiaceae bacterium]